MSAARPRRRFKIKKLSKKEREAKIKRAKDAERAGQTRQGVPVSDVKMQVRRVKIERADGLAVASVLGEILASAASGSAGAAESSSGVREGTGPLSDWLIVLDFDKTITLGLQSSTEGGWIRGGDKTLEALETVRANGAALAVLSARTSLSSGLLSQLRREPRLSEIFGIPQTPSKDEVKTIVVGDVKVQATSCMSAVACGFNKHAVVAHLATKIYPSARRVAFLDDNINNAFEVSLMSPPLIESISRDSKIESLHSYWCSTYLEELGGRMSAFPDDPDYCYQAMFRAAQAAFGLDEKAVTQRDANVRKVFQQDKARRRANYNGSRP